MPLMYQGEDIKEEIGNVDMSVELLNSGGFAIFRVIT